MVFSPVALNARLALGRFDIEQVMIPGSRLRLAILPPESDSSNVTGLHHWIETDVQSLTSVYGWFPLRDAQILVVPIGGAREPVPWAQVMRGGDAAHLYVDETRPLKSFLEDWTLYHELSHLLHPLLDGNDTW